MFFRKKPKQRVNTDRIDSLIGETTEIIGNICFKGGLRLDGRIKGNISTQPDEQAVLFIGPNGVVEGDVNVTHLIIEGTLRGSIYAESGAELGPSSKVEGNIYYASLEIHPGAVFEGHMVSHQNSRHALEKAVPVPTDVPQEALHHQPPQAE